jgi:dienelactone hydrolase
MRRLQSLSVFLFAVTFVAGSLVAPPASAAAPRPVAYPDYDAWNSIRTPRLSDDGAYLAYTIAPGDGDLTLVVRNVATGAETREARGNNAQFTADGKFVVYAIAPVKAEFDAAVKAKKPEAEQPKSGLGILELATGKATTYDRVKSSIVPRNGGRFIAFLHEPAPRPSASPAAAPEGAVVAPIATPSAAASGEPAPTTPTTPVTAGGRRGGRAGAAPAGALAAVGADIKRKDDGAAFVLRDLQTGTDVEVPNVTAYAISDDDRFAGYATETRDGRGDGMHVRDLAAGTVTDVLTGAGRYKAVAASRNGRTIGFLSDVASYAQDAPHYDVYVVDTTAAAPAAKLVVGETTAGMPRGAAVSDNRPLAFSKDGQRIFLGTAAAPTPVPSSTPVPIAVDLWTYKDLRLQSVQFHDQAQDRRRTYEGVYSVATGRFAQLASSTMQTVTTNENPHVALGIDQRPYEIAESWGERDVDLYAVSLTDGSRRLLVKKAAQSLLSPDGSYVVLWNRATRHWNSIRVSDGKRTVLAPEPKVTWYDETDDHPGPPPDYGSGGFIAGSKSVILYDRFDPWMVDLATGAAKNLTHGAGRAAHVVYSVMDMEADRDALPAGKPFLLSMSDQSTYGSGFASLPFAGGTPHTLIRADKLISNAFVQFGGVHQRIAAPVKARNADRIVFTQETYREFRDLWSSDLSFAAPKKVSHVNPQLTNFTWGTEQLISYTAKDGTPLRAVLLLPDKFDPKKKYPMLTYFYEKWTDQYHTFYPVGPRYPTLSRYVSHGYVVLLPDVVYKTGHPGQSALKCIMAAVEAVSAKGYIDQKHIGIAGHSWAAYQINYMITQTDRFRAVEAGAAVANMTSAYGGIRLESGNVREGQYESGQSRIGATPWDRPDLYLENSGLFHIKNIHTPYLTMHNTADGAVPFSQGVEFLTAMRRLGKPAYMFSFEGKDHNLRDTPADREQLKYWTVRFDEWFDYWLKGAARPSWFDGTDYLHRGQQTVRGLYGEKD